jgi:hypothetical protein
MTSIYVFDADFEMSFVEIQALYKFAKSQRRLSRRREKNPNPYFKVRFSNSSGIGQSVNVHCTQTGENEDITFYEDW